MGNAQPELSKCVQQRESTSLYAGQCAEDTSGGWIKGKEEVRRHFLAKISRSLILRKKGFGVFLPEGMCCLGHYFSSFWVNWAIALPAIKAYLLGHFCTLSGSLDCCLDVFLFYCYIPIIQPIMYTTRCEETWLPGALQVFPVMIDAVEILDLWFQFSCQKRRK